jgi:hypothetical protein
MIFTVNWTDAALQQLAAIWLAATDRNAITLASDEIDRELRVDPDTLGRPTFATVREYKHPPLAIEFEVVEPDRIVHVLSCWLIV